MSLNKGLVTRWKAVAVGVKSGVCVSRLCSACKFGEFACCPDSILPELEKVLSTWCNNSSISQVTADVLRNRTVFSSEEYLAINQTSSAEVRLDAYVVSSSLVDDHGPQRSHLQVRKGLPVNELGSWIASASKKARGSVVDTSRQPFDDST
jgi:hypothetical protein